MDTLLSAIESKDEELAAEWQSCEEWRTAELLLQAQGLLLS